MSKRIKLNFDTTAVLLYRSGVDTFEEYTQSIDKIYRSYYYGNFTGYDVYFNNNNKKFTYSKEKLIFIKRIIKIDVDKKNVFADDKITKATRVEKFELGYFKIIEKDKYFFTKNLRIESNKYKERYNYYQGLANYALNISKEDEPLYYLSKTYKKLSPTRNTVLFNYLNSKNEISDYFHEIIIPFNFNQSQYDAINKALTNKISIIEGPPGTGKTQTILNLLSNIISTNKTCAVISNNNTAIDNVYEKLVEEGLSFFAAKLGSRINVDEFFGENNNEKLISFLKEHNKNTIILPKQIKDLTIKMQILHKNEIEIAQLKNELVEIKHERDNFGKHKIPEIKINNKLNSNSYLNLVRLIERPKKINLFTRIILNFKYKINIKQLNIIDLLTKLEYLYYIKKSEELEANLIILESKFKKYNKENLSNRLKAKSKTYLLNELYDKYINIDLTDHSSSTYKKNYNDFIQRYPVVLSTTQSLFNNIPEKFLFDYLIIDEASQSDLLSSVVAMSCAKNVVVVGDSKQLEHIDEERLFNESEKLAKVYEIEDSYRYEKNSLLGSIKKSVEDVPTTLLREHYRSVPDIINFCNKMFYNNQLIPMTKNNGKHINIIKTVKGNHARINPEGSGQYNQREIDEVVKIVGSNINNKIGVITPFRYQANLINEKVRIYGVETDTVHKFQGREKSEIILSFVVNSLDRNPEIIENRLYDFITNEKLLNVAVSRAKNKITAIVSNKLYYSKDNVIADFINYAENIYGSNITKESNISSVFDNLYMEYTNSILNEYNKKPTLYKSELLMKILIDKVLLDQPTIGYAMHVRLSKIISNYSNINEKERKYILHPWTHVDFLFYNKITKNKMFVLEVDGIKYHEQKEKQVVKDEIKDRVIRNNNIGIYRFKTNESNEKQRLTDLINKYK